MYILKNAYNSITRNIGRNLLIGIIIIAISSTTAITLAIKNSANSLINSYQESYETIATIGINRETMKDNMKMDADTSNEEKNKNKENMLDVFSKISSLTTEEIENYGDSKYVKKYYYQKTLGINSDEIETVSMTTTNSDNVQSPGPEDNNKQNIEDQTNGDFTLIGYSSLDGMEEFLSGKYSITSGEVDNNFETDSCVINSELASSNNIEVGDTIVFTDPDDTTNTITLTVTGIFEENSDNNEAMSMFTSSANTIITNINVIDKLLTKNENIKVTTTPSFVLTSKDVIADFENELTEKGLSEYLSVSTNLDEVESATSTISNVSNFATTFLIITLIIGGIVLFVINMINIRERKYEIGVLRTIGMKKSLLTLQFISELLIVAIISLSIGASIGAVLSIPVSNSLLEQERTEANERTEAVGKNFGRGEENQIEHINGVANIEVIDSIDAVVDIKVLGQLFIIGILLTLISSSASMISIQKFSPLTILKERS